MRAEFGFMIASVPALCILSSYFFNHLNIMSLFPFYTSSDGYKLGSCQNVSFLMDNI